MSNIQTNLANNENTASFDPRAYTIVIKRVVLEGEPIFHGRVMELPDLEAFEATYEEAYNFLIDGVRNAKVAFEEHGRQFPTPLPDETPEYSGRATIRMPAWLHAQLDYYAKAHQTSLNQYMVTLLSWAASAAPTWVAQNQLIGSTHLSSGSMGIMWGGPVIGSRMISEAAVAQVTMGAISLTGGLQDLQSMQYTFEGGEKGIGQDVTLHLSSESKPAPFIPKLIHVTVPAKTRVLARSGKRVSR